jgi:dTDP-4-dehydrorhamnose reductase
VRADRILVIGASGLVGSYVAHCYRARGAFVVGTGHRRAEGGLVALDVRRPGDVRELVDRVRPRTVVLAAALADVDRCQREPSLGLAVNVLGTCHVAEAAAAAGARVVYLSTDYVFDGRGGPYGETDRPEPLSAYGRQKLAAEGVVLAMPGDAGLVVRTSWVFGWDAPARNFVARLIERTGRGETVAVPDDQASTPTYAGHLAAALCELDAAGAHGVFHVSGRTLLTRHRLALMVAEVFGLPPERIVPASTAALRQDAPRPPRAGLRVAKVEAFLGRRMASAREGLEAMWREGRAAGREAGQVPP